MRITGGKYKGLNLPVSKAFNSRPTTDYAREGLFNILCCKFDFEELKVLDLFTGTGIIGFEFASRGCKHIDMVDINKKSLHFIKTVALKMNEPALHVIGFEAFKYITVCKTKYDIVFADPPYDMKSTEQIPAHIFNNDIILPGGWFILEHSSKKKFTEHPYYINTRKYGNVLFTFFQKS